MKEWLKKAGVFIISGLGALGTALQNYAAIVALLGGIFDATFAASKAGLGVIHSIAVLFGGFCSGLVNFFVNVDLLKSFVKRLTGEKKMPKLSTGDKVLLWLGSAVFVITGILFGLTTIAFGSIGILTGICIAAGVFVAAIMIIQELETWFESFDDEKENAKTIFQKLKEWWASLTPGKTVGLIIAIGNVIALSLLFTFGLATALSGFGVPILAASIIGVGVAFTGGAFTEFFFYNKFLAKFFDKLVEKFTEFWQSKYSPLGLVTSAINAVVNSVLAFMAVYGAMIGTVATGSLLTAVGIAIPPLGVVIAIGVGVALFAGAASFILCLSFWKDNSTYLPDVCCASTSTGVINDGLVDTSTSKSHELREEAQPLLAVGTDDVGVKSSVGSVQQLGVFAVEPKQDQDGAPAFSSVLEPGMI